MHKLVVVAEVAALRVNGARMVALTGREAVGTWAQLQLLMLHWQAIEALLGQSGPFIYSAKCTTLPSVDLCNVTGDVA